MADIFSKEKRSKIMGLVKGKNTKPEKKLRSALHSLGFRFRLHDKRLPGTPDIKLTRFKTVIFVNGCFWHGHSGCKYYTIPKSNNEYWVNKIDENITRDQKKYTQLKELGWNVIIVWTCQLNRNSLNSTVNYICDELKNHSAQAHK